MTTSPSEPVDNDQSQSSDDGSDEGQPARDATTDSGSAQAIDDSQLPDELQPGPDNPLATPDSDVKRPASGEADASAEGQPAAGPPEMG